MSTITPKTSPRSSPIPLPSPSTLSASGILTNFTKCFDGRAAVVDESNTAAITTTDAKPTANTKNSDGRWGPSHSIDSDEESTEYKNLFIKSSASPSRSSQRTGPTAPVTASTNKGASTQNSLNLKTGMSGVSGGTGNVDVNTSNSHGGSRPFWHSFNVSCADSIGSLNAAGKKYDNVDKQTETDTTIDLTPDDNTSSPTAQLISQSAKAAAQAAASVVSMMGSLSMQVGSRVGAVNTGRLNVVPFCGNAVGNREQMEAISECEQNTAAPIQSTNTAWDIALCGREEPFCQQFDYNAFREQPTNDETSKQTHHNEKNIGSNTHGTAKASPQQQKDPKGYEIRLKSTFSQQHIKTQRSEMKNEPNEAAAKVTNNTAPSAFDRTHPNHQKQLSSTKNAVNTSTLSSKTTIFPIEYLSIPINSTRNRNASQNDQGNTSLNNTATSLQRTASEVSELTMRSHAERYQKYSAESRRMAYYAVGHVNENDTAGGNRRCYFSGIGIRYGEAYYAGSVRQGPRTLVVFCLPSALGLPSLHHPHHSNNYSADDMARYLQSLPQPNAKLLNQMKLRYTDPFESLPVQVQSPDCWKLYVKFCYFSGLPIAEGEMHYRVKPDVKVFPADGTPNHHHQQQEISLSQEIMEAVNGEESAEILRLPNQKTFDYLRKHYSQQSIKLNEEVFDRKSWEMVMPEI